MTLICSDCRRWLAPDAFYRANRGHEHRHERDYYCKDCTRVRSRDNWRARNPDRPTRIAA